MSWRADIYRTLCNKLRPLKEDKYLQYIDLDKGQFDHSDKHFPIQRAAVLIDIEQAEFAHMTNKWIEGQATIGLTLILNNRHLSFDGAKSFTDSLHVLDLIERVINACVFACGTTFDALHLTSEELLPHKFDGLQSHRLTFSTQLHYQLNTD